MENRNPIERAPERLSVPGIIDPTVNGLTKVIPPLETALSSFLRKPLRRSAAKTIADFALLPETHKQSALKALQLQLQFVNEAIDEGVDAFNEFSMVRMAMRKLNLFSDENILEKMDSSDVVEIIDMNMIQVYRSYSCFGLYNYSIAELVTYPWYELYERPSWVTDKIMELSMPVFQGERSFRELPDLMPPYVLKETRTEERAAFLMQEKFYARMISSLTREPYLLSVKKVTPIEAPAKGLNFL